jgi:uncharacterized membrane protein
VAPDVNEPANILSTAFSLGNQAALLGCGAAVFWGGGDFFGGMGVRAGGGTMRASLKLILISHTVSLLLVAGVALALHRPLPHGRELAWGVGCGVAAAVGLMLFYVALSQGHMGPSAAISGLLSAGIPAAAGMLAQGAPSARQALGFLIAAASIWMIAAGAPGERVSRRTVTMSLLAGVSFGVYFIGLRMANSAGLLWAMATARAGSVTTTAIILGVLALFTRKEDLRESKFGRRALQFAMMTVLLDTAGNLMFIASTRLGRLDVAAVLASLYPASTILLAAWILHERPVARQRWGMLLALAAVVMITL